MTPKVIADFESQLATAISVGGTSFTLSSVLDDDGIAIPNGLYYFTVDNGTSAKEYLKGTLTGSSVASVSSVSRQGAETSGAVRRHRIGASIIITDFATYLKYMDSIALVSAPDASTTTKGVVEAATLAEVRARTALGGTGAALVVTPNVAVDMPTENEKAALAGGGALGTPSGSNKFITEQSGGFKFGGDGSNGALTITSGVTTLDLAGAEYYERNYTSISITGTASVAFSNPHANGTIIALKSQGNVTITSSATPCIDTRAMGAAANNAPTGRFGNLDENTGGRTGASSGGAGGTLLSLRVYSTTENIIKQRKSLALVVGAGGGNGSNSAGGVGGGTLYIECAVEWNFTGIINTSGANGTNGSQIGGQTGTGGGGGGNAGMCVVIYNSLTANSGTITSTGGNGGNGSTGNGTGGNGGGGGGASGINTGGSGGSTGFSPGQAGGAAGGAGAGGGGAGGGHGNGAAGGTGGAGGASVAAIVFKNNFMA